MVPILVAVQEIHRSIYIVSHVVGCNARWLHQENGVPPPLEDLFLHTKHLGEIVLDFQMLLINFHILQYGHIVRNPAVCNSQSLC